MNMINNKRFIVMFVLMIASGLIFPELGIGASFIDENLEGSYLEDSYSESILLAKAKKKKKKSKKKKSKKDKANKEGKEGKEAQDGKEVSNKKPNSYWGIAGGFLYRNQGIIYGELRKDIFSNFFLYTQGKYVLGTSKYFSLYGGGLGALYSYRMSELIGLAGGFSFSTYLFSLADESQASKVFKNSSTETTSMTLVYAEPRVSVALHFTKFVALTLEAVVSVTVMGAEEEVKEEIEPYIGTGFSIGAGAMITF